MNIKTELTNIAKKAQEACRNSLTLSSEVKDKALKAMAMALLDARSVILSANKKDLRKAKAKGISSALLDRLMLSEKRIQEMADSLNEIANLPDPVGEVINIWRRPNGLWINKVRVPIGVIAIIYESRPNVTSDCIGLCFKSGNSVILRGGSEAINSNLAIAATFKAVLKRYKMPEGMVNMVTTIERAAIKTLLSLNNYIDLVMPRGGEGLINQVMRLSRIPVIKHYKGICHVYVDEFADLKMAEDVCYNAKVQRPGVCNAMESMLVHRKVAARFLPGMLEKFNLAGVEIRGCASTKKLVRWVNPAKESDYYTEYLDLILSVKVVKDSSQAIEHINNYGTHHSDSIISDDYDKSLEFMRRVDSACVYANASTRFTDGYQFGLGAEIGISTDKLHARGPMALEELTTYKYMVMGNGQVRQ